MITSGVIITALICGTVLITFSILSRTEREGFGETAYIGDRLGRYVRFLKAMSEIRSNPESRKGWDQFTTALHEITLTAKPAIVVSVQDVAKGLHEGIDPMNEAAIQKMIVQMRADLGPKKAEEFDESTVTILPSRSKTKANPE